MENNLFVLAEMQLQREGVRYDLSDVLDYAITIRKYMDIQARNKKVLKARYKK